LLALRQLEQVLSNSSGKIGAIVVIRAPGAPNTGNLRIIQPGKIDRSKTGITPPKKKS
jgi:hypothetical protein